VVEPGRAVVEAGEPGRGWIPGPGEAGRRPSTAIDARPVGAASREELG